MVSEEERALSGVLFTPGDPELIAMKRVAHNLSRLQPDLRRRN